MSKQTAVEWLVEQVESISNSKGVSKTETIKLYNDAIQKAKAMEKEQTEENMTKAITFGWELSNHHRLNTEEKLLQMQKDFITSVIEGGDK